MHPLALFSSFTSRDSSLEGLFQGGCATRSLPLVAFQAPGSARDPSPHSAPTSEPHNRHRELIQALPMDPLPVFQTSRGSPSRSHRPVKLSSRLEGEGGDEGSGPSAVGPRFTKASRDFRSCFGFLLVDNSSSEEGRGQRVRMESADGVRDAVKLLSLQIPLGKAALFSSPNPSRARHHPKIPP